jgi:copper(I)-binding protein
VSRTARRPRRAFVPTTLALMVAATLTVSGCAAGQYSQTADQVAAIDGANGIVGDLTVLNARLAPTSGQDYPAGSNARVLFWISNDSINPDTLSGISTTAAKSVKITGDAVLPGQSLVDFASDTGSQVVVTGFLQDQYYGVSIPMTFSFKNAGSLTMNVPIEIPPDRTGNRETIEILPPHPTPIWEEGAHGEEAAAGTASKDASHGGNVEGAGATTSPAEN